MPDLERPVPDLESAVRDLGRPAPHVAQHAPPSGERLVRGLESAGAGLALVLLALPGPGVLLVGVVLLQVLLVLGLLEVLGAVGRAGACLVAGGAVVAAGVVALVDDGQVDGLAAVVALGLVAALLHQLLRRGGRPRVTASLRDTLLAVVLVVSAACLVALRASPGGRPVAAAALGGAAAALLVARATDRFAPVPRLVAAATRGLPGSVLGLVAGTVVGAAVAGSAPVGRCALLGLAAAATALLADLLVSVGTATPPATGRPYARVAVRHVTALLPYAVVGPVALVGGRLVLG